MFLWLLMQCSVSYRHACKRHMNSQECFFFFFLSSGFFHFSLHFSWSWKSLPSWCFFIHYYGENRFVFQASKNIYVTLSSVFYEQTEVQPYSGILLLYYIDPDSVAPLSRWKDYGGLLRFSLRKLKSFISQALKIHLL